MRAAIITLMLVGQFSCSKDNINVNTFQDDPLVTTLNGTWKVISFEDLSKNTSELKSQENSWGYDIVVKFDDNKDPHEFSGVNTTNSVFGEFDYIGLRKFKLRRLGTTFVGQPKWGDEFSKAVLDVDVTFKINNGRLRIYYYGQTRSVTLTRE